jgi:hypothetical protein
VNFALLWIDALALILLWVAACAALLARLRRRWMRGTLMVVAIAISFVPLGTITFGTAQLKFSLHIEPNGFVYLLSLLVASFVSAGLILYQARRREPGLPPAAAKWRRLPLLLAWLTAGAIGYMTVVNMDLALRARCAFLSTEVNSVYLATLPAITYESQNAAPLYQKVFDHLKADRAEEDAVSNAPTGNNETFDANEPATISFLKLEAPIIALMRRAAALPACRFDEDLTTPDLEPLINYLNAERNAANVLTLDVLAQLANDKPAEAIADANAILHMSRQFGVRPLLVSGLVAIGIDALANRTLEVALSAVHRQGDLDALHLDNLPSMGRCFQESMRGEERYGLLLYGTLSPQTLEGGNIGGSPQHPPMMGPSFGIADVVFRSAILNLDSYVRLMTSLQDAAVMSYYQSREQLRQVFGLDHSDGLLISILAPSLSRAFQTLGNAEAKDACAVVAIAMTHYRLDHGSLPDKLDELVPKYLDALPLDPFDGHPLGLAMRNGEHIIYSVGANLKDEGGNPGVRRGGNVTFTLKDRWARFTTMKWN